MSCQLVPRKSQDVFAEQAFDSGALHDSTAQQFSIILDRIGCYELSELSSHPDICPWAANKRQKGWEDTAKSQRADSATAFERACWKDAAEGDLLCLCLRNSPVWTSLSASGFPSYQDSIQEVPVPFSLSCGNLLLFLCFLPPFLVKLLQGTRVLRLRRRPMLIAFSMEGGQVAPPDGRKWF